jgi:hypothetical protein
LFDHCPALTGKWQREGKILTLEVGVPVGAEAEVSAPAADPGDEFVSGAPASTALGVKYVGKDAQAQV